MNKCETCKHFHMKPLESTIKGECRFQPPKAFPIPTQQGLQIISAFPIVNVDQWCSEYTASLELSK